jgi:hypothetical protein
MANEKGSFFVTVVYIVHEFSSSHRNFFDRANTLFAFKVGENFEGRELEVMQPVNSETLREYRRRWITGCTGTGDSLGFSL